MSVSARRGAVSARPSTRATASACLIVFVALLLAAAVPVGSAPGAGRAKNAGPAATKAVVPQAADLGRTAAEPNDAGPVPLPAAANLSVITGWPGIGFSLSTNPWVPPDPQIAAGAGHVMEVVNVYYSIWATSGVLERTGSLTTFFGRAALEYLTDPKIEFDGLSQRWFVSMDDLNVSSVLVAVSTTSDPLGPWAFTSFASSSMCPDQPLLGVGSEVVVLSVNAFSSCTGSALYLGAEYWVINKTQLVQGATPSYRRFGPTAGMMSVYPVRALTASPTFYMVSVGWALTPTTILSIYGVTGVPPAAVNVASDFAIVATISMPPNGEQPGTPLQVNTGDSRVLDAFANGGHIWLTFGDSCLPLGATSNRSCFRLTELNAVTGSVLQAFDVGQATRDLFYPAIAEDVAGDLVVVFGYSSSSEYPGIMIATQNAGDAANTLRAPTIVRTGLGSEALWCPDSVSCRYGDYFGAWTDPMDPSVVWTVGEYGGTQGWGTEVAAVGSVQTANLTVAYAVAGGGTPASPPSLAHYVRGVLATSALATTAAVYPADVHSTWSVPPSLSGTGPDERWHLFSPAQGQVAGDAALTFAYQHQYSFAVTAEPAAGGSASPTGGWANASASVTLSAVANPGWQFQGWQGSGPGSYTGAQANVTVTLTNAMTETALFYPGLTLTAGAGGALAYRGGDLSGTVSEGTTQTIYAPAGTTFTITAAPAPLNDFAGWGGDASGHSSSVTLTLSAPASVRAGFSLAVVTLVILILLPVLAIVLIIALFRGRKRRQSVPPASPVMPAVPPQAPPPSSPQAPPPPGPSLPPPPPPPSP